MPFIISQFDKKVYLTKLIRNADIPLKAKRTDKSNSYPIQITPRIIKLQKLQFQRRSWILPQEVYTNTSIAYIHDLLH